VPERAPRRLSQPGSLPFLRHGAVQDKPFARLNRLDPVRHGVDDQRDLQKPSDDARMHAGATSGHEVADQRVAIDELAGQRADLDDMAAKPWRFAPAIGVLPVAIRPGFAVKRRLGTIGDCVTGMAEILCDHPRIEKARRTPRKYAAPEQRRSIHPVGTVAHELTIDAPQSIQRQRFGNVKELPEIAAFRRPLGGPGRKLVGRSERDDPPQLVAEQDALQEAPEGSENSGELDDLVGHDRTGRAARLDGQRVRPFYRQAGPYCA
jgi:hypothetical protein